MLLDIKNVQSEPKCLSEKEQLHFFFFSKSNTMSSVLQVFCYFFQTSTRSQMASSLIRFREDNAMEKLQKGGGPSYNVHSDRLCLSELRESCLKIESVGGCCMPHKTWMCLDSLWERGILARKMVLKKGANFAERKSDKNPTFDSG